jgi:hypothetical protein
MLKLSVSKLAPLGLGLIFSTIAFAEEPSNGTLPDGTPFRRDAQGVEVIDYVAELENSVTYLKERVRDLEQQVETGKDTIGLLKEQVENAEDDQKAKPEPRLFEVDLDIAQPTESRAPISKSEQNKKITKPTVVVPEIVTEIREAQPEVATHQLTKITRIKPQVVPVEQEVAIKPVVELKIPPRPVIKPLPKQEIVKAPEYKRPISPTLVKPAPPKLDPIEIAKSQVRKEIADTKKIKFDRDSAFDVYSKNPNVARLKISMSPAQSKEKRSLESLDFAVRNAKRERDIAQIRTEIVQIQKVLRDDIALISRISKLN